MPEINKTTPLVGMARMLALVMVFAVSLAAQPVMAQDADDDSFDNDYGYTDSYVKEVNDPLEPLNRGIFRFNEIVDGVLIKPVAQTYRFIVPEYGRDRVHNVVTNLGEPVNILNGFLQANPERGFTSMWRFILNSTFGVLGIFDFASYNLNLYHVEEDFGQSLGYYGWGGGPYLVLPILGPSNARDAFGRVVDIFSNPFNYVDEDKFVYGRAVVTAVDARSRNIDLIDDIYRTSLDPYSTFRSMYGQRRDAMIRNNQPRDGSVAY